MGGIRIPITDIFHEEFLQGNGLSKKGMLSFVGYPKAAPTKSTDGPVFTALEGRADLL